MSDLAKNNDKKISKKIVYLIVLFIAIVTLSILAVLFFVNKDEHSIELKYGDYSIKKARYKELIKEAQSINISSNDARTVLIKSLKSQQAAKEVGIKEYQYKGAAAVAALETSKRILNSKDESYYQRAKYPDAINNALDFVSQGGYQFATYNFPFTYKLNNAVAQNLSGGLDEYVKNHAEELSYDSIRKEVAYAKSVAEKIHKQLSNKEITDEEAVRIIKSDERLLYGGAGNDSDISILPASGKYESLVGVTSDYSSEKSQLDTMKKGEITPIYDQVGSSINMIDYPPELRVDEFYMKTGFTFMHLIDKVDADKNIKQKYTDALGRM